MFKHIVGMKFKDAAEAPIVKEKLEGLLGVVPTLRTLEVGLDELKSERSWHLILITTFDSKEDWLAYDIYPAHEAVKAYIATVRESGCSFDFHF